jgi:hypothetical protein
MASPRARPLPARRIARLFFCGLGVALIAGACRLDDRTLTGRELVGAGDPGAEQCPAAGDNSCETCLYQQCCDELQACGPGSPCARYLTCVTNCNDNETCIDACAANSPAGVGGAVALSVCAGSRCTVCSGQSATATCDPMGPGACQSPEDCDALEAGALQEVDVTGCPACDTLLVGAACERCLSAQTGLSPSCSSCVTEWLSCAVDNCLLPCQASTAPDACELCMSEAGCTDQLSSCGFSN